MKVVILAGGRGTRISEETAVRPKPMVEIGGLPILYHIMKIYSHYGYDDFVICLGYKGHMIKEYFANYHVHLNNVTFHLRSNEMTVHENCAESWRVTLVDTGSETLTGGRIWRAAGFIGRERFMLTYGDGLANVDIAALLKFHESHGRMVTVTAVRPISRFGAPTIDADGMVTSFKEKPLAEGWINGGFFVMEPVLFDQIAGDDTSLEYDVLSRLAEQGQMAAFRHEGFWYPMDTLREKEHLEALWSSGKVPWKVW
ncbi:MAG: glucose-1-phosphate cytidylyltransferase [Phycisphaerae bacterium]|nr:glucose-1-phosphate cytidylyltransferase [Phycisphaerae bacterium]